MKSSLRTDLQSKTLLCPSSIYNTIIVMLLQKCLISCGTLFKFSQYLNEYMCISFKRHFNADLQNNKLVT